METLDAHKHELLTRALDGQPSALRALGAADWTPHAQRAALGEPYGRAVLLAREDAEVVLMWWRAQAPCAPHDHGQAGGHVLVLEGEVHERAWGWSQGELVAQDGAQVARAGEVVALGPGRVHDMVAPEGALTLHLYKPRIRGMRVFDVARRRTLVVADDCGAWVPAREALIEEVLWWP